MEAGDRPAGPRDHERLRAFDVDLHAVDADPVVPAEPIDRRGRHRRTRKPLDHRVLEERADRPAGRVVERRGPLAVAEAEALDQHVLEVVGGDVRAQPGAGPRVRLERDDAAPRADEPREQERVRTFPRADVEDRLPRLHDAGQEPEVLEVRLPRLERRPILPERGRPHAEPGVRRGVADVDVVLDPDEVERVADRAACAEPAHVVERRADGAGEQPTAAKLLQVPDGPHGERHAPPPRRAAGHKPRSRT